MNEIENDNIDKDYAYSRDTYYELIEKSKQSLDLMLEVARESEHPLSLIHISEPTRPY